jgi:hypothetical protein
MSLLASPAVANSDVMTVSAISDLEKVAKEDLPPPPPPPPPPPAPPGLPRRFPPIRLDQPDAGGLIPGGPFRFDPGALRTILPIAPGVATDRPGLAVVSAASAAGVTTAARDDTDLKLGETEVMAIAQDYSDPGLGDGLRRAAAAIGGNWPSAKDAMWLGESGKPLALDSRFRSVGEEKVADFANLLKSAVAAQDAKALDDLLASMA